MCIQITKDKRLPLALVLAATTGGRSLRAERWRRRGAHWRAMAAVEMPYAEQHCLSAAAARDVNEVRRWREAKAVDRLGQPLALILAQQWTELFTRGAHEGKAIKNRRGAMGQRTTLDCMWRVAPEAAWRS